MVKMLNKFIGIGRNTKDGELRTSDNDLKIYTNTLAITNDFKNKEGNYDSEFINYIAYKNTAEYLSKYSSKGTLINIVGRIHTRSYEKDNEKKYVTEIIVESASVLTYQKDENAKEIKVPKYEGELKNYNVPQNITTEYDTENSDVKLSDDDIDKVFGEQQMELPF